MLTYLLDTNTCIAYLNDRHSGEAQAIAASGTGTIALCTVVQFELYFGAYRSSRPAANLALLQRLFAESALPFDQPAAQIAGEIRTRLAARGTPIGPYDLQIAGIALVHNLTLVTRNTREFSRVPGLRLEDWHTQPE